MIRLVALSVLAFLLPTQLAFPQIDHGTIIVWMATDKDFVLAADSRATFGPLLGPTILHPHRDDECKIRALNDHLLFAVAGPVASRNAHLGWDIRQIAADLMRDHPVASRADIDTLARAWAGRVGVLIGQDPLFRGLYSADPIIKAAFAGSVGDQRRIHVAEIYLRIAAEVEINIFDPVIGANVIHIYGSGYEGFTQYVARYGSAMFSEPDSAGKPAAGAALDLDGITRITYRVAELAIRQDGPFGTVGGAIDQAHLNGGGIEWLHQKKNCQ